MNSYDIYIYIYREREREREREVLNQFLSLKEMESVTRHGIQDEAVCVCLRANVLGNNMGFFSFPSNDRRIVGQVGLFGLGAAKEGVTQL